MPRRQKPVHPGPGGVIRTRRNPSLRLQKVGTREAGKGGRKSGRDTFGAREA